MFEIEKLGKMERWKDGGKMDEVAKSTGQEIDKIRYSLLGKVASGLFCLRQTLKFRFL
jgi:hypothetical protein